MSSKKDPADSRGFNFFKESVYQRSDTFDANKIASDSSWNLDRAALVEACREMRTGELAPALLYAVFHGDVTFTEYLWRERGPFKTHLKHTGPGEFELNEKPYRLPSDRTDLFPGIRNVYQLKDMFDLIYKTEITGLLDGAGALFLRGQKHTVVNIARQVKFEGELPVLSREYLSSPELMVAMIDASHGCRYRKSYDPILCWATPEMVEAYGEYLDPYVPVHGAKVGGEAISFDAWQKTHADALVAGVEPQKCNSITLRCAATTNDVVGQIAMQAYGNKKLKHGIYEKEGHVLCHTSARFLAEFERPSLLETNNLNAAREFAFRYVPIDFLTLHAHPKGNLGWPTDNGYEELNGGKALGFMNLGEDIHKALGPILSHDQWKFILNGDVLKGDDIVTAVMVLGLSNEGMNWKFEQETPGELKKLGFKCVPGTEVLLHSRSDGSAWDIRGSGRTCVDLTEIKDYCKRKDLKDPLVIEWGKSMLEDTFSVGLWPFSDPKPPLSQLIPSLGRKKSPLTDLSDSASMARLLIKEAPIEECVKHAKKASEWSLLANIHGADAVKPYVHEMPLASKGRVFTLELGV